MRAKQIREECDGCGYGPVECTHANAPHGTPPGKFKDNGKWLCDFCGVTHAGNAALYPTNNYESVRYALRAVSAGLNLLYEKLKKNDA